jgi:Domain of unknown function (DUF543)
MASFVQRNLILLNAGLIKTTSGALVGGLLGLALFKAGGGWRSASVAAGVGVGLGSTYQRAKAGPKLAK